MPCACLAGLLLRVGLEAGSCPRLYSGLKARSAGKSYAPTRSAATAHRTSPRAVWAGLIGPVRALFSVFYFSFFSFLFFLFYFLFLFVSFLFCFLFFIFNFVQI
jgi:hypothetical protein